MAKAKFERTKSHINISAIGHVDHGRTTLIAAVTKYLALKGRAQYEDYSSIDEAFEGREYGITINTAHVEHRTDARHYAHANCPGHVDYIKDMTTSAVQMGGAILVTAIIDNPMAQTRGHILLAHQMGVPAVAMSLNKYDQMDDEELLELIKIRVRRVLSKYEFPGGNIPVIRGSTLSALACEGDMDDPDFVCVKKLMDIVDNHIPTSDRKTDQPFLMPVEDVFTTIDCGTVVTGRVERGTIKTSEEVKIASLTNKKKETVVTGIEMLRKLLNFAEAGDNIDTLLHGVIKTDVEHGRILCKPSSIRPHTKLMGQVYVLSKDEGGRHIPFFDSYRPQFYFHTADITGVITLPEDIEVCVPGGNVGMKVELITPIAVEKDLHFVIREGGRTVGSSIVINIEE